MPRMFDILRDKDDDNKTGKEETTPSKGSPDEKKKEEKAPAHTISFPKKILKSDISAIGDEHEKDSENHSLVSQKLISAVKKHGVDDQEKAKEIYEDALETIKNLIMKIRIKENLEPSMNKIYELLDAVFNQLVLGDSLLDNIYENKKDDYYLPSHIVNVLILSTVLGLNMGFNKSRLSHLGLASIFYDMGMDALREITTQPRKLSDDEYYSIKTHISKSLEILEKNCTMNDVVKETIGMHHERVDKSGYPRGLKSDKINPYAKIIGLIDTYEALTHNRSHHEAMNTHKAVKFLISSLKDNFDSEVMKIFINKMSVYPVGSIVRLDSGELARVIGTRPGSPLRPIVILLRDSRGEAVKERTVIDLSKHDFPAIKEAL